MLQMGGYLGFHHVFQGGDWGGPRFSQLENLVQGASLLAHLLRGQPLDLLEKRASTWHSAPALPGGLEVPINDAST